jgi:hypothetical protein
MLLEQNGLIPAQNPLMHDDFQAGSRHPALKMDSTDVFWTISGIMYLTSCNSDATLFSEN